MAVPRLVSSQFNARGVNLDYTAGLRLILESFLLLKSTHTHTHKKSTSTHQQVRIYVINVGYSHDSNNCRDSLTYNIGIILGSSASYLESLFVLEASAALLSSVTHFVHVNMKL